MGAGWGFWQSCRPHVAVEGWHVGESDLIFVSVSVLGLEDRVMGIDLQDDGDSTRVYGQWHEGKRRTKRLGGLASSCVVRLGTVRSIWR